ncbi:MAG: hypothetical protein R3C99_07965 [Pirellulaceae bacterium]
MKQPGREARRLHARSAKAGRSKQFDILTPPTASESIVAFAPRKSDPQK